MSTTRKISPTVKEYVLNAMKDIRSDLDIEFCLENNIKFENHEVEAENVKLFSKESLENALKILEKK